MAYLRASSSFQLSKRGTGVSTGPQVWVLNSRVEQTRRNKGGLKVQSDSRARVSRQVRSRRSNHQSSVGNIFPRERLASDDVAKAQAEVLQAKYGRLKSPAKEMALDTGSTERACRNQIAGLNAMNLADFFNSCRAIPELRAWGMEMMGAMDRGDQEAMAQLMAGHRAITLRIETGTGNVKIEGDGK